MSIMKICLALNEIIDGIAQLERTNKITVFTGFFLILEMKSCTGGSSD